MRSPPAEELRRIARAARGLLEELAEEDVDHFDEMASAPLAEPEEHSGAVSEPATP